MSTPFYSRLPIRRMTAMLVSPSDSNHAALRNIFSFSSWTLQAAYDIEEALAVLEHELAPVVICEMEGDWRSLVEQINALKPAPKVIVAARNVTENVWADVLQNGGYQVLQIPWESREVFKAVSQAWRSWSFACHKAPATLLAAARTAAAVA